MSAQWARLIAKATSRPPTNTGRSALTSGRWLPPTSGRFRNQTSPSRRRSFGTRLRNSLTVKPITPRWIGMSRPWAMSRPSASVSADERSPASLRSGERAERELVPDELRGHTQVDALDALARRVAVEPMVASLKCAPERLRRAGAVVHLELVVLPGVAQVGAAPEEHALRRVALVEQRRQ